MKLSVHYFRGPKLGMVLRLIEYYGRQNNGPPGCAHFKLWNLLICYATWQREIKFAVGIKVTNIKTTFKKR